MAEYSVYIFFSLVILYLGVQGVRKEEPRAAAAAVWV